MVDLFGEENLVAEQLNVVVLAGRNLSQHFFVGVEYAKRHFF